MSERRKLTREERQTVLDRFCGRCAYCGKQITMQELNVDHLVPLRKGGEDRLYNMYPSCRSCNQAKSTLDIEQFREFVQTAYQRAKQKPFFRIADAVGRTCERETPVRFYFESRKMDDYDDYMVTIDEMMERAIINWLDERTEAERKEIIERLQKMDDGAAIYISDEEEVE